SCMLSPSVFAFALCFFFQAEDGIRDATVTGVQTCALPILTAGTLGRDISVQGGFEWFGPVIALGHVTTQGTGGHFNGGVMAADEIGRASCRETRQRTWRAMRGNKRRSRKD